uniref:Uncharacterized protein n=1 Tax=Aegilops tauschii TaxID=37682 RepID=M8BVH0_AEGTA
MLRFCRFLLSIVVLSRSSSEMAFGQFMETVLTIFLLRQLTIIYGFCTVLQLTQSRPLLRKRNFISLSKDWLIYFGSY